MSFAYEPGRAKSNLADEFATCAAYYMLASQGHDTLKNNDSLNRAIELSLHMSRGLSNDKVTLARLELSLKEMTKEIDFSWYNMSILINKYADFCKNLLEKPEHRLMYWLNKN